MLTAAQLLKLNHLKPVFIVQSSFSAGARIPSVSFMSNLFIISHLNCPVVSLRIPLRGDEVKKNLHKGHVCLVKNNLNYMII